MKNGFRILIAFFFICLLPACVPASGNTSTEPPKLLATETVDPDAFSISTKITQRLSNEEIINILFSRWLDHLRSNTVSPYWRIEAYDTEDISETPVDQTCAKKLGAVFLREVQVYMKTTDPLLCTTECDHSAWTAGGGNIIDAYSTTKPFSGAVFKSGNIYTLQVITAVPPCDLP